MSIEIIDTLSQKNGGDFAIVDSNDIAGGYYQVETEEEMHAIPESRRKDGMLVHVNQLEEGQNLFKYKNGEWIKPKFAALETNTIYVGSTAPEDTSVVWVDIMRMKM